MATPLPHQMMTCPYNPSHQVEHYRMHIHLQKCRKQHPNSMTSTCPFDCTHVIRNVEMNYHVSICSKRLMLDRELYVLDDDYRPVVPVHPQSADFSCAENWDDDNLTAYNPSVVKKGTAIITKAKGMTPSERRLAREQGRLSYAAAAQLPVDEQDKKDE